MATRFWIKLYTEIVDDPKMGRLSDRLYRRVIELFALAGELDDNGRLPDVEDIAWRLRMKQSEIEKDLQALAETGIVTLQDGYWFVTKFSDRQSPIEGKERVKRYREAKQKEEYYGDTCNEVVTECNESCNEVVTNRYTEKNREEIDKNIKEKELDSASAGAVFTAYEHEIGVITPHIAERIKDACELYPESWLIDAFKIASEKNARNMKYVDAILQRWKAEGKDNGKRAKPVTVASKKVITPHSGAELAKAWGRNDSL